MAELRWTVVVRRGAENVDARYHLTLDEVAEKVRTFMERHPGLDIEVVPEIPFEEIKPRREWYVYLPEPTKLVLSGYATEGEAGEEAERVRRELREVVEVLPRNHRHILEYARKHPAWAAREGFASTSGQADVRPEFVTDDVYIEVGGETTGRMARMRIALTGPDRGRLMDGREVVRVGGRWVYRPTGAPPPSGAGDRDRDMLRRAGYRV